MPITLTEELIKKNPVYKMGLEEGIQKGKEEGKQEGILEAKRITILNLRKTLKLAPEDIANIVELSVDRVKEILKEEELL